MFLDLRDGGPAPEPWQPPPPPRMTKRQRRLVGWIVGFNLLMLLVGPLAGATLFEALVPLLNR